MENQYQFNAESVRDNLVKGVADLAEKQNFKKVVIGISGGKDSTVCAAICARALGRENVYGVMMPDGVQKDLNDWKKAFSIRIDENIDWEKKDQSLVVKVQDARGQGGIWQPVVLGCR